MMASRQMLEWDATNRLVALNYAGTAKRSEFAYDGLNRRIKIVEKTGATVTSTKNFVWIGNRIAQERDANNVIHAMLLCGRRTATRNRKRESRAITTRAITLEAFGK